MKWFDAFTGKPTGLHNPNRRSDPPPIQIVSVTLSTALATYDPKEAEAQVRGVLRVGLGVNLEIGRPGHILPFELEGIKVKTTTEERMPRP